MRSSTLDAPPGRVPAAQVAAGPPAAGNAWLAALTVKLADPAPFTAEIVAAILECLPF
jgi:hypothetical protein